MFIYFLTPQTPAQYIQLLTHNNILNVELWQNEMQDADFATFLF